MKAFMDEFTVVVGAAGGAESRNGKAPSKADVAGGLARLRCVLRVG